MTSAYVLWLARGGDGEDREFSVRPKPTTAVDTRDVEMPDAALVARLRSGDERAFESLYHAHARAIATYIASILGQTGDVQDVVQESYLALWRRRTTLAPADHVVGLLYRTARNLSLTRVRHHAVVARFEAASHDTAPGSAELPPAPDIRLDAEECHRRLADALAQLPERQRLAIHLRFFEEMSYAAIGSVLGVSENAAFMLVSRAVAALRPIAALFVSSSDTPRAP